MPRDQRLVLACLVCALTSSCGTAPEISKVDPDPGGPTAELRDTAEGYTNLYHSNTGRAFVALEVNGKPVVNAIQKTRDQSSGTGARANFGEVSRSIPVGPVRVKVLGTHITGAPISQFIMQAGGDFVTVSTELQFDAKENRTYRIKGLLLKGCPSIWIDDEVTRETVSATYRPPDCNQAKSP